MGRSGPPARALDDAQQRSVSSRVIRRSVPMSQAVTPGEAAMDRPMTFKEIAKITAGAVVSLVIVGWLMVLAMAFLTVL
ncbi:hypothetical protein BraRD5C2_69660 [Bradyrhizobium sp. RD5-C2]|nr:hypothetical protein BraRD5C2_69660 [Bradyrhizobium sp. RD5-C2]